VTRQHYPIRSIVPIDEILMAYGSDEANPSVIVLVGDLAFKLSAERSISHDQEQTIRVTLGELLKGL
jgi:hypothetical protein